MGEFPLNYRGLIAEAKTEDDAKGRKASGNCLPAWPGRWDGLLAQSPEPRTGNRAPAPGASRVDVRIDPKVDVLLLKLPESTLREVTEYAARNKLARHEAITLLVRSGLVGAELAERLNQYRQAAMELDIADALQPIKSRRSAHDESSIKARPI